MSADTLVSHATLDPAHDLHDRAADTVGAILVDVHRGRMSLGTVERLREEMRVVAQIAEDVKHIVGHAHDMARSAATCTRDLDRLETEMWAYSVKRAEHALRLHEIEARRRHIDAASDREALLAGRAADIRLGELDLRAAAVDDQHRAAIRRMSPPAFARADRTAARRERHAEEAARIAREVQAGCVPTGAKQPYHAFGACTYLTAQRAGCSDAEALTRTREAVLERMCGPTISTEEAETHRRAYEELKAHVANAARFRATEAAMGHLYDSGEDLP